MDEIIELVRSAKLIASNAGYVLVIKHKPDNEEMANEVSKVMEKGVEREIQNLLKFYIEHLKGIDFCTHESKEEAKRCKEETKNERS